MPRETLFTLPYTEPVQAAYKSNISRLVNCPKCQKKEQNCFYHETIYHYERGTTYIRCLKCKKQVKVRPSYEYVY